MDWFPLWNSLRIAAISTAITFALGILTAYYAARTPRAVKGVIDSVMTLPMVLPPTVVGFFLLKTIGPLTPLGAFVQGVFHARLVMVWYAGVFATTVVTLPLMYRTARGAFEALDPALLDAGRTLGLSNTFIFWRILLPNCRQGILAGAVLAFARALGEYGATTMVTGYIPGRTATISTTVYQAWREGSDALAYRWVAVNLAISFAVLVAVNLLEARRETPRGAARRAGAAGDGALC